MDLERWRWQMRSGLEDLPCSDCRELRGRRDRRLQMTEAGLENLEKSEFPSRNEIRWQLKLTHDFVRLEWVD